MCLFSVFIFEQSFFLHTTRKKEMFISSVNMIIKLKIFTLFKLILVLRFFEIYDFKTHEIERITYLSIKINLFLLPF